jgi:putative ABC transport system substrate-binding protein
MMLTRLRQQITVTGWRYTSVMLMLCLLQVLVPHPAIAETTQPITIDILKSHSGGYYDRFVNAFNNSLQRYADQNKLGIRLITTLVEDNPAPVGTADVYVTVGADAAVALLQSGSTNPAIFTLLPGQTFEQLQKSYPAGHTWHDAVFIDYPATTFLHLIKHAMPGKNDIGVILGPDSRHHANALEKEARKLGFNLAIETIQNENEIITALNALQGRMQVFLALPDKQVHNRRTAKTILLSTYRYNVPVIAYSQAYVKAGALAGMYADPEDMADQAARKLAGHLANTPSPPGCGNQPDTLSIDINNSVARLLARNIPDAAELERLMQKHLPSCAP